MARRGDVAAGAALASGAGLIGAPGAGVAGVNAVRRYRGVREMNRSVGDLGGLARTGEPVDPLGLSGRHGGKLPDGGRRPSARAAAVRRYDTARVAHLRRIATGGLKGRAGAALVGAQLAAGATLAGSGLGHFATHNERGIRKDVGFGSTSDSQLLTGIPPWRANPVDPLQMHASSSVMAGVLIGAAGRRLTRRERKAISSGAYRFVGAQHQVVTPTGMRGLVTG